MKATYEKSVCLLCMPHPCACKDSHNMTDLKTAIRADIKENEVVVGDPDGFPGFFDQPDDDWYE